jgi:3-oxoacyl-[acyl-carrier-protein] synthase III
MWNVGGILKKQSNQVFKFDVRNMAQLENNLLGKYGNTQSKAEKFVFETVNKWIILDIEELHNYIKINNLKTVYLNDLINNLNWNTYINK